MKDYLIWTDYGQEGWNYREADTFEEAKKIREEQLSFGDSTVIITKRVKYSIIEE